MAFYFFLCALFVAGVLQLPGVAAQSQCVGASFDTFFDGFRYTASLSLNGCQSSQINISRLVSQGACSNERNNNFGSYPECSNGGVNLNSPSTDNCNAFFSQAPSSAIVLNPSSGTFDNGRLCSDSDNSYVFVQTTCSSFTTSQVRLVTSGYGSGFCWDGNTLSGGAVAGIAIAGGVVVFVIVFLIIYFCCRRRRAQPVYTTGINMQPYPPQPAPAYGEQPAYAQPAPGYPPPGQGYQQGYPQQQPGKYPY